MPELKELVGEACRALAHLDVNRLEEMALSCEALNRDLATMPVEKKRELANQAQQATADMAVFARVLEATRSNLKVMERLGKQRAERLEYKLEYKDNSVAPQLDVLDKGSRHGID
jgi:hypothetical protein